MRCFRVRALSENHTTRPAALVDQLVRPSETGHYERLAHQLALLSFMRWLFVEVEEKRPRSVIFCCSTSACVSGLGIDYDVCHGLNEIHYGHATVFGLFLSSKYLG